MRVLMVMGRLIVGGAETVALELAGALKKRGCHVSIAAVRSGGEKRDEFARAATVIHDGLAVGKFDLRAAFRIARIIRREQIDSVIIVDVLRNGTPFTILGALISGRSVNRICWCHSIPGGQGGQFARWLDWYISAGLLDAVVCVSRGQQAILSERGLPKRKMPLIHNGVDLDRIERAVPWQGGFPAGKRLIVQVANAMPDKDPGTLLRAAGLLAQRRDDFHFLLAGRQTDSTEMAHQVAQAGAQGVVTLAGHCDDVPGLLKAADVFALSTTSEVFSIATLEAMAAGVPVVVSDIPAFEEMFADGREGLKVPPGDADALAEAIERLLDDETLRHRLGDAGRKRAEEFTTKRMTDKFHRLLTDS